MARKVVLKGEQAESPGIPPLASPKTLTPQARNLQWRLLRNCSGNRNDMNKPLICADVR